MRNQEIIRHIVNWLKEYCENSRTEGFVIGISGGIDSAVTSTLCAMTGKKVIVLNLPIRQFKNEFDRSAEHIEWLKGKDPLTRATKGYESALNWMWMKDNTKNLPLFFEQTRKYDEIRNESITEVFPELKELFDKHEKN